MIRLPQAVPGPAKFRLVDRTNNADESWFHGWKHDERRRSGRKILAQDLEQIPAAAALARNLMRPDYVELVCGSLHHLPAAFAELDRQQNEAAATKQDVGNIVPPVDSVVDFISASLPKTDRKLVRIPALEAKILAAAKSRSPAVDFRRG